jgi:hypothetical protein
MTGSSKEGLNGLLVDMLQNENKYIPNYELKQLLHGIEDDATEIYRAMYDFYDTKIRFNIGINRDIDINPLGRQSAKSLECIRKSIKKNLHLMQESVRVEFEGYLKLCGEA